MLTHVSWNQFLLTIALVLLLYYTIVLLLCFRQTLATWLKKALRRTGAKQQLAASQVMGSTAPAVADTADIRLASPVPESSTPAPDTGAPQFMADLLRELQTLLDTTRQTPLEKGEFFTLLRLVAAKYNPGLPAYLQDQVSSFLLEKTQENFPFALSPADLQELWTPGSPAANPMT